MTPATLSEVMEATWPAAARQPCGPFTLRDGAGGGKRVSAASLDGSFDSGWLGRAEAAMAEPLFLIREGQADLDDALAARGYAVVDPVVAYAGPVADLAGEVPFLSTFPHWPPLGITRAIWAEGGIGPARVAVMERVTGPRTAILARADDHPAGAAFVAVHGDVAMLHALETVPAHRRKGAARHILRTAAVWAQDHGATTLALVVTRRNSAARALYTSLNMAVVGRYHYRTGQAATGTGSDDKPTSHPDAGAAGGPSGGSRGV